MVAKAKPNKGALVRAAFSKIIAAQINAGDLDRAERTQKALQLLHIKDAEIGNEAYLAQLHDAITGAK